MGRVFKVLAVVLILGGLLWVESAVIGNMIRDRAENDITGP